VGKDATDRDPDLIYISIIDNKNSARVVVYCGKNSSCTINAGDLAKSASLILSGSGGGSKNFGQGGGKSIEKLNEIKPAIENIIAAKIG
jgi:alanyl-tRNA synthetase